MSERPPRYFAYGSNLHPLRLGRRTPSLELLGLAELPRHALRFHKWSDGDRSTKADASHTGVDGDRVLGAVYGLDASDFPALDAIEGLGPGGYELRTTTVSLNGRAQEVFFYAALPSHIRPDHHPWSWYRDIVWQGARWHGFPAVYVDAIARVPAAFDPDEDRHAEHEALIAHMAGWRAEHGFELP